MPVEVRKTVNPIYEMNDSFLVDRAPTESIRALVAGFRSAGFKPHVDDMTVSVKTGSNAWVRLFGTMLPWGRRSIPVGMTVTLEPSPEGTLVVVHGYDRLGFYLDARWNPAFEEETRKKITYLSGIVKDTFRSSHG
jgi:hypothetical protein